MFVVIKSETKFKISEFSILFPLQWIDNDNDKQKSTNLLSLLVKIYAILLQQFAQ